ncbi:DNA (cytosine-5-)-methyltransferase [Pseudomonas cannabina]|uniref:Cytosine-specific methyltransferase n=3 Tax=Pseudomonas syringae group TaxID=136849 RepID=A0A3M3RP23_PSECA|nr:MULTISPECIES: DNA (cytosine-5-)-methyltransferase [Pseudomonas syringae group]KPB70437.1 Cytosine-specific methyltransferase [Pseudomonas syringae pv. maculicola]KPW24785.1 Cytosine-specific methyltransferase [Pseudomonas cannabina pv. alisalensis]QHE98507.1 DNA (cytosine-5-)-methyltransferase [Pseudomonas syringae pv. maculicola str. ES4326]RMN80742.1 Cytosine-specific methyltransferase [Pseudomonas cannabina]RMN83883.1 Cytosine-specific methyltransferase [Pseudomonas cannabina pv. alisale
MNLFEAAMPESSQMSQPVSFSDPHPIQDMDLLRRLLEIYDQRQLAAKLKEIGSPHCRETVNRWVKGKSTPRLTHNEHRYLESLLPTPPAYKPSFTFIDLFAGIGGIRKGFEAIGGECVFTSEWNTYAVRTYKANHYCDPKRHKFNQDIRTVTLSDKPEISDEEAYQNINREIPDHDVLLAGFPCQPFSLAGVSKKNSLGRKHGFECETQGTLFFDVARIIAAKRPSAFLLENVKNLKSHDKGNTFRIICEALDELGYEVADVNAPKGADPKVIDAKHFVPQHRERIVLVGFRRDLNVHGGFTLRDIEKLIPKQRPSFGDLLDKEVDSKYILTPNLWDYLYRYAEKHRQKGNGFGFGLTRPNDIARTLSARYHKDGSEILVDRGFVEHLDFNSELNQINRPRRLTPHECSRLMGFDKPGESKFVIPVSDTQAYRQFGNSVAVPVFEAVAKLMKSRILAAKEKTADAPQLEFSLPA